MAVLVVFSFLFSLIFLVGYQGASAVQDDFDVMYVCDDNTLLLPWNVPLDQDDVIDSVNWFYKGRSEEIVALFAHGQFIPMSSFSHRVEMLDNAGLILEHVRIKDYGNYSAEVTLRNATGEFTKLTLSVYVYVIDGLQTTDGQLRAFQLPSVEYMNSTGQYHVVLGCGTFTYPTHPPFEATWVTPSGMTLSSTRYQDNSFRLLLPNPIEGGSYTCHLPPSHACLHDNTSTASVQVDKMETRLAVMEAHYAELDRVMEAEIRDTRQRNEELLSELNELKNKSQVMESQIAVMKEYVSFHARMAGNTHVYTSGSPIVLSTIVNNQGGAYDPSTGSFTAPLAGIYCFMASTATNAEGYGARMYLMVDNHSVAYGYADHPPHLADESMSLHAVVRLTVGQNVWLKSNFDNNYYFGGSTIFSGFLISANI